MTTTIRNERQKAVPEKAQAACLRIGGQNLYGEPMYRVQWSPARLSLSVGQHDRYDDSGNFLGSELRSEMVPKYPIGERFILEVWKPASYYGSPERWAKNTTMFEAGEFVETLGDFPSRGDYEWVATFEDEKREYVYPTATLVEGMIQEHRHKTQGKRDIRRPSMETVDAIDAEAYQLRLRLKDQAFRAWAGKEYLRLMTGRLQELMAERDRIMDEMFGNKDNQTVTEVLTDSRINLNPHVYLPEKVN